MDEGPLAIGLEVHDGWVPTVHPRLPDGSETGPCEVEDVHLRVLWGGEKVSYAGVEILFKSHLRMVQVTYWPHLHLAGPTCTLTVHAT